MRILIAGQGLAGTALAWHCHWQGIPFTLTDPQAENTGSWVASGLFNPVVLKRRTLVWKAAEMMQGLIPFYQAVEAALGQTILHPQAIVHQVMDHQEENQWQGLLADSRFEPFLAGMEPGAGVFAQGVAQLTMQGTGWVNVPAYLHSSRQYFQSRGTFFEEAVSHGLGGPAFEFKGIRHSHVVWANGIHHPALSGYFRPTIGEVITVRLPGFPETAIYHGKLFLIPLGESVFRVGATYRPLRSDSKHLTEEGRNQLLDDLRSMTLRETEVLDHKAGIRANTFDRRPLLGTLHEGHYHINGLGSRGVLISQWLAETLVRHWTEGHPLPAETRMPRP
jgi:glycine/D-amino acid oxidase-like deaminating enzyme